MRRMMSFRDFDWLLLGMVLLLSILSVLEIYSTTVHTRFAGFASKQVIYISLGVVGMFIVSRIDYHRLLNWAPWGYGLGILALVAVLSPLGHKALGGRRWIKLGPMLVQPSEFLKFILILAVARYFANLGGHSLTWRDIFKAFALVGVPMLLVHEAARPGNHTHLRSDPGGRVVSRRHQLSPGGHSHRLRYLARRRRLDQRQVPEAIPESPPHQLHQPPGRPARLGLPGPAVEDRRRLRWNLGRR